MKRRSPSLLTPTLLQLQSVLNSPFVKMNEASPESEKSRVRRLLQDIESELQTIDIQITRAQEYILLLQDKRAGYLEDMKKLQPAIAPHKSLPPEILVEIFLQYAADITEQVIYRTAPMDRRVSQFPWVLGHICSRWRHIALAEPRIWGTIGFNGVEYGNLPMLNEAFRRGGQSPLWLSANQGEYERYITVGFLRNIVCPQSKRITELSLLALRQEFEEFLALPRDSFPVLEAVEVGALGFPRLHNSEASVTVFQGAARLRRINIRAPLRLISVSFPMNLCLCWPQLTHIKFPDMPIQISIAHELMNLSTNLRECHICLEANRDILPPFWIKFHSPSSIHIPYLQILEIYHDQRHAVYVASVFNKFLRPLLMPNLEQFKFSLQEEEPFIVPTLTELAAIVNRLSRPNLVSEMLYVGEGGLIEVTSALPFLTSLKAPRSVLDRFTMRIMAQKDHLSQLTSLTTNVAFEDMDALIDMLEIRWVRGIEARRSGCSSAGIITSAKINVADAPGPHSVSGLSLKIREIQDRLKLKGATIDLVDDDPTYV